MAAAPDVVSPMHTASLPPGGRPWHALPVGDVLALLGSDAEAGLSPAEARRRLAELGPNRIADQLAGVQWLTVSWTPLAALLRTAPLSAADWLLLTVAVLWPVGLLETIKALGRR